MKARGGMAALALVAVASLAATGLAAKPKIPSTVSLRTQVDGIDFVFRGRVRSPEPKCERRRTVRVTAGHDLGGPIHKEGTTRTDSTGRYELRVKGAANTIGGYQAKALRKVKRRFVCKAAKSPVVTG